jgi:hypothetical protein
MSKRKGVKDQEERRNLVGQRKENIKRTKGRDREREN